MFQPFKPYYSYRFFEDHVTKELIEITQDQNVPRISNF